MNEKEKHLDEMLQAYLDQDMSLEELETFEHLKNSDPVFDKDFQIFEQVEQIYQSELSDIRSIDLSNSIMIQIKSEEKELAKVDNFSWIIPAICSLSFATLIIYFFPAFFSWTNSAENFFGIQESYSSFQSELLSVPQNFTNWLVVQEQSFLQYEFPEIYPSLSILLVTLLCLISIGFVILNIVRQKYQFSH